MTGIWYNRTAEHRARLRGEKKQFPTFETVRLAPLPFLEGLTVAQQRQFTIDAVRLVEEQTRQQHDAARTRPFGIRSIQQQEPHDKPKRFVRSPAPLFHASTREEFWKMRFARELTVAAYRRAAIRLRHGERSVQFPVGSFPPPFVETRAPP